MITGGLHFVLAKRGPVRRPPLLQLTLSGTSLDSKLNMFIKSIYKKTEAKNHDYHKNDSLVLQHCELKVCNIQPVSIARNVCAYMT